MVTFATIKRLKNAGDLAARKQIERAYRKEKNVERHITPYIIMLACIFEVLYLLLVALSALPGLRLSSTPLAAAWQWTLFPSHILLSLIAPFVALSRYSSLVAPLLLGLTLLGLSAVYVWAIMKVRSLQKRFSRHWLPLLLTCTLIFGLTLLVQPRLFSDDVFTYIFSGRILIIYGADPLNTAPIQFPGDVFLPYVISGRATPNIYGPLWLCISSLLAWISNSPVTTLLLFKGVALLAHLSNSVLIWSILDKIAPSRRLVGTMVYAWNPLALIELAGSGHSEGVLMLFLLLALWFYVQQRGWAFMLGSFLIFGLASSINLIVLLLAPLYAWFDVRGEQYINLAFWAFCWRLALMSIPILLFLLPFWRGPSTFFAITSAVDMDHFVHAPVGTLAIPIRAFYLGFAHWAHLPGFLQPIQAADVSLRTSATFIFVLIYLRLFGQVRHAPTTAGIQYNADNDQEVQLPGLDRLLTSWTVAIFWCLVLASGWFWPWYVLWMLWIIPLRHIDAYTLSVLILSATALFIYPFVGFSRGPLATYQTALIFGIPLVCLIIAWSRQKYQERISLSYDR
jgi:hypothetical protein